MNDGQAVLLTGATGALGPALAAEMLAGNPGRTLDILIRPGKESIEQKFNGWLESVEAVFLEQSSCLPSRWRERVRCVEGDLRLPELGISSSNSKELRSRINVVVHAAADTQFLVSLEDSRKTNVSGTQSALQFAQGCKQLSRFLLVSTVCTSGTRTGLIKEQFLSEPQEFVNNYEQTKWEAEQVALAANLPLCIARVSIVIGSHATGAVNRPGAFHHLLKWFSKGLVPLIPGTPRTRVDLVSSEIVAQFIARALAAEWNPGAIWNIAAGNGSAAYLTEIVETVWAHTRPGQIVQSLVEPGEPFIVDQNTFDEIRLSKTGPRDRVVRMAMDSINSFLPMLLYPRMYDTTEAEKLWGGPLPWPDWNQTLVRVMQTCGLITMPQPTTVRYRKAG